jgi:hypothetical protein
MVYTEYKREGRRVSLGKGVFFKKREEDYGCLFILLIMVK